MEEKTKDREKPIDRETTGNLVDEIEPTASWEYSGTFVDGIHLGPIRPFDAPDYDDDSYNGMPRVWGPYDRTNNFFILVDLRFHDSGIDMSDIYYLNQYSGLAQVETIEINEHEIITPLGQSYLPPPDGLAHRIPGTGGSYSGNSHISISITVSYLADVGHGPDSMPISFGPITFPTLPELKQFILTGEVGNMFPFLGQ